MPGLLGGYLPASYWLAGSRRAQKHTETIVRLKRKSALGGRRQPAVAGRRVKGRGIDHALAPAGRQVDQHYIRPQPRNLGQTAMATAGTSRTGGACRAIALFGQGSAVRRSVGVRLRFRAKAREALARCSVDFRKAAADRFDSLFSTQQFFTVVAGRRANRTAAVCVQTTALVRCRLR